MSNTKNKESMAYKNKLKYTREYNKKNNITRLVSFNKNVQADLEILEFIETKRPFSSYVKSLILKDMNK